MDFIILNSLEKYIQEGRITEIQCEVQRNETPEAYKSISNKELLVLFPVLRRHISGTQSNQGVQSIRNVENDIISAQIAIVDGAKSIDLLAQ
jgi:hypothetical protein